MANNIVSGKNEDLSKEFKRITDVASGTLIGYSTQQITKKSLETCASQSKASRDKKASISGNNELVYNIAMERDANYVTYGRKRMRSIGLQNKSAAIYGRALILTTNKVNNN